MVTMVDQVDMADMAGMAQVGVGHWVEVVLRPHGDLAKRVETRSLRENDTCPSHARPFLKKLLSPI